VRFCFLARLLIFCSLLTFSYIGNAQKIGLGASLGYNISKPTNTQKWPEIFQADMGWEKSIRPAIFVNFPLRNHFAFQSEIALVDQGWRLDISGFHAGDTIRAGIIMREKINFLQFNQMLSYEITLSEEHRFSLLVECGPYFASCVSYALYFSNDTICPPDGKINIQKDKFNSTYDRFITSERRSQFGMAAGLGMIKKTDIGSWAINFSYEQSLTNPYRIYPVFELSSFPLPRVMAFSISYTYNRVRSH